MNNKKGFTLVEIAIVIAIIGLLTLAVLPRIADIFGSSVNRRMKIQENEVKDAALIYLDDHCRNPYGNKRCTLTRNSDYTYTGRVLVSDIIEDELIDEISIQGATCSGYVDFVNDEASSVCLRCDDAYESDSCEDV